MTLAIGSLRIERIEEWCKPFATLEQAWVGVPPDAVARNLSWLAPGYYDEASGKIIMSVHSWLVRTRKFNVLIDTCFGNDKNLPGSPGDQLSLPWIERLAAKGLRPEQIDFVMCTHLHADHVGWNTRLVDGRWVPTFPNARYIFGRKEFEHWSAAAQNPAAEGIEERSFRQSVAPCMAAGKAELVEDGYTVDDDLSVENAPGHTVGTVLIEARSRGESGVFVGDIIHTPLQIVYPDINTVACELPEQARASRRRVLQKSATNGSLLLPTHFPAPYCGRVLSEGDGFAFKPGA